MTTTRKRRPRTARLAGLAAAVLAAAALPLGAGAPSAVAAPADAEAAPLPPGVVKLNDGEPCPIGTLCLYRDYNFSGPAYGIGAGYEVDLRHLPMAGAPGGSAADNVSSWVDYTGSPAFLRDDDTGLTRSLFPNQRLQEPSALNDTVDRVFW
ncbi:peptidase inhibitor family I36 protein [Streptomyces sp. TRM49041]|uniref:peptidase inhibitor family I36 protein n=1 Tax=Streptomyces sp. TRM49041 TaxID=2603216 RepID=UPI0011EDB392|nr:peptidase inhibitor family I36 protein [Streptomyces sp. TRM49041]